MADLRAQVLDARDGVGGSWRELHGRAGAVYWYELDGRRQADVCCPGCGRFVCQLAADTYPLGGTEQAPTCGRPITFSACCGWSGHLRDGFWVPG